MVYLEYCTAVYIPGGVDVMGVGSDPHTYGVFILQNDTINNCRERLLKRG